MRRELSILIPTYNDDCTALVAELLSQAQQIAALRYEVLVADDGSTDAAVVLANQRIATLPHCTFHRYATNRGRAAIRNSLAAQAQYEWLLFVDGGNMRLCKDDYLYTYLAADEAWQVVYGGYTLAVPSPAEQSGNLRYKYERQHNQNASAARRRKARRPSFQSCNFMVQRDIMRHIRFDERFLHYGYEDVLLDKALSAQSIAVHHLDNPIQRCAYVDNTTFLHKTTEALRTLKEFESELQDASRLLHAVRRLQRLGIAPLLQHCYNHRKTQWRAHLQGAHPSLFIYNLYKLGYYLSL